jgi:hypothetical protein
MYIFFQVARGSRCECQVRFNVSDTWSGKVFAYYRLTNYYQGHRRYVKSRDDAQLLGRLGRPHDDCGHFSYNNKLPVVPCGAIANSMFNDTFRLQYLGPNGNGPT